MNQKMKLFQVMEWHRGEFIPLKVTNAKGKKGKGKVVKITQETADQMNLDFNEDYRKGVQIKYFALDEKETKPKTAEPIDEALADLRKKYEAVTKKKVYWGWNSEQLTKKISEHKK